MNHLKVRTINNKTIFYTANDGQTVKDINTVCFQDVPDAVFTIVKKDNSLWVHLPQKNMNLVRLEDAILKHNLIIYRVS
jgi:hypothetical protein